jgi:nucleotide-binding universal stress UspA family protein
LGTVGASLDKEVVMRVLIAVDGTDHSVIVARTAHRLFGDAAEYLVLNCAQIPISGWTAPFGTVSPMAAPMMPGDTSGLWPIDVKESSQIAQSQAEEIVESTNLTGAESIGDAGDPVTTIIDAARQHQADVIVVGHEDRSWFSRLVEGSVSREVIRESDVPVLVVPSSDRAHHQHDTHDKHAAHDSTGVPEIPVAPVAMEDGA